MAEIQTIEEQLRTIILNKYKSIRAFTQDAGIPYTTFSSMIKNGIAGASINTVSKICNALSIDITSLADGKIVKISAEQDEEIKNAEQAEESSVFEPERTMSPGEKIHNLRVAAGLSYEALAEASGISVIELMNLEQGVVSTKVSAKICILAELLNIPTDELLPNNSNSKNQTLTLSDSGISYLYNNYATPEQSRLNDIYDSLNSKGKEKLLEYAEDLKDNGKYTDKNSKK